jgi:hypothetical protein
MFFAGPWAPEFGDNGKSTLTQVFPMRLYGFDAIINRIASKLAITARVAAANLATTCRASSLDLAC